MTVKDVLELEEVKDVLQDFIPAQQDITMNRETPKTCETWRHFKGNYYKIITIGHHSETKEKLVVYYDLSGKNSTIDNPCIRPLQMFMSEVDHDKYPTVEQKYRFEKVG